MSTTTDRMPGFDMWPLARHILLVLVLWFALLAGFTYQFAPTRFVLVVGPSESALLRAIARSDVAILEGSGSAFRVAGTSGDFVRQLYRAGAWLVLPVGSGGCGATLRPNRA
jgi:hypothetical protein